MEYFKKCFIVHICPVGVHMNRYKCIDECINELGLLTSNQCLVGAINLDGAQCAPYDMIMAGDFDVRRVLIGARCAPYGTMYGMNYA